MDRAEVVHKLVIVFRQNGYEGTTLSQISKVTGLGRASLYHHFPSGKKEMAQAVLEHVGDCFDDIILAPLRGKEKPAERIRLMCDQLSRFFDSGRKACLLAIFTLGSSDDHFHGQVNQMLHTWIDSIGHVLMESGIPSKLARQRAEDAVIQVQGGLVLTRGLKNSKPFDRVLKELPVKLFEPILY